MKFEKHLCILWGAELHRLKDLKKLIISSGFEIVSESMYEINSQRDIYLFVRSFYHNSNTSFSKKIKRVNPGKFCALEVKFPGRYDYFDTSRGCGFVNAAAFQLKRSFRKTLESCADALHVSDTSYEYQVQSLQLKVFFLDRLDELRSNCFQYTGFRCLQDLKLLLNASLKYVVMRSPEAFNENSKEYDVDILVKSRHEFIRLIQGERLFEDQTRALFKCKLGDNHKIFDVREPSDNYYPSGWACEMLENRFFSHKYQIYLNSLINEYFSLAYHCFLHKDNVAEKHLIVLGKMYEKLFRRALDGSPKDLHNTHFYVLKKFMSGHSIIPSPCSDTTVGLNWKNSKILISRTMSDIDSTVFGSRFSSLQNKYIKYLLKDFQDNVLLHSKNGTHHRSKVYRVYDDFVVKQTFYNSSQGLVTSFDEARMMCCVPEMYRPKLYWSGLRLCSKSNQPFVILLMEHIDGIKLSDLTKKLKSQEFKNNKKLIVSNLLNQFNQIQVLFQSLKFRHRDLRPENIMVLPGFRIKIIDFGLSVSDWEPDKDIESLSCLDHSGKFYNLRDDGEAFNSLKSGLSSL